jgi:hypothetical protein
VSIQLDDDDVDPGRLIRVTGIATDDKGVDWIELDAERRDDNDNGNDNAENSNDNADNDNDDASAGDPVLDERRRFDCDDRIECANVWELRPNDPGEYTLRVRARDTDGQERSATTELDVRNGATPTPGPTPTPSSENQNGNTNGNENTNDNGNANDNAS